LVSETALEGMTIGSQETKTHVVEACMYLSSQNIGALITIEKYNSLDQYAERAIIMNAKVSKELLINIFIPNTPLHDGAVIIRGDEIRCAGAYYVLSETEKHDKTMGSRHRAALGISEVSDSLTIVVSEETGTITIVVEGIMIKANDREKMYEYINMYIK
jgi:diadenylate cyclase